jgi:hypothetical protein
MIDPVLDPVLASTRFRVTATNFTAAQRKHMRWLARRSRTWVYLVGFALVCAIVIAPTTPHGWSPIILAASAAGGLSFVIGWSLIVYIAMPLAGHRAVKTQRNLSHEWRVELRENGMRAVTPNQDNFVAWADYVAWSEDAQVLLFYQGERLFQFIPKHGLEPGFQEVVHRLVAHIPKR